MYNYMFGTAGTALIREVSLIQFLYREVPLYLHCIYLIKVLLNVAIVRYCTPGMTGWVVKELVAGALSLCVLLSFLLHLWRMASPFGSGRGRSSTTSCLCLWPSPSVMPCPSAALASALPFSTLQVAVLTTRYQWLQLGKAGRLPVGWMVKR